MLTWGTIGKHFDGQPQLSDERPIVAVWRMDARTLDWLLDSQLDPGDEVTRALVVLREQAKDYAWGNS